MKKPTQIIQTCFLSIAILSSTSCTSIKIDQYIENSPLSELESQAKQAIESPETKEIYEQYFSNGKIELAYKQEKSKVFLRPNLRKDIGYSIDLGIEIKY